jgi:tetratricopeptide (TPR) repeat protein
MAKWLWLAVVVSGGGAAAQEDAAAQAYAALREKDYDKAEERFRKALAVQTDNTGLRKELAYTLLKMGETEAARDEFAQVLRVSPEDEHSAMEYAFLCNETKQVAEARRIFKRLSGSSADATRKTAFEAFRNIDASLEQTIARCQRALEHNPDDYSAHAELAAAADRRDEYKLAAAHYHRAWLLRPSERGLLVDLGRMLQASGDVEAARAAWLAASRGGQPRAAEQAREQLPSRYPYAAEFEKAIEMDPSNLELGRELAFLYLAVGEPAKAETQLLKVLDIAPDDLLSLAQVGLLRLGRGERDAAMPMLEKVMRGKDEELARRVKEALNPAQSPAKTGASSLRRNKEMGDRSYQAGYLNDALRYYRAALEEAPGDAEAQLKLGWTYNMLRQDEEAIRWFDMARKSPDPGPKSEAERAWRNLRSASARVRTTAWAFPMFSSRWHEGFTYGQVKSELRIGKLPLRPYLSLRLMGDFQRAGSTLNPQYLSESSVVLGAGVVTSAWRGLVAWAEAGSAVRYRDRSDIARIAPDYRGGISFAKLFGKGIHSRQAGWFFETNKDIAVLSRFRWDLLFYTQNRAGYTLPALGPLEWQAVWNVNLTADRNREPWANFTDTGPGLRFRLKRMPASMVWSLDWLRGAYWIREGNPFQAVYHDIRAGFWYAVTR